MPGIMPGIHVLIASSQEEDVDGRDKRGHDDVERQHPTGSVMRKHDPHTLKSMLGDGGELALVDVREELIFSQRHLLWARSIPLSRLELNFTRLVPRRSTRIVLCDDNDGLAERAANILSAAGYADVASLAGGVNAWTDAGYELFSGVHVPSKAFGEYIEHECGTPSISADELHAMMRASADMVVLDSRPLDEFRRVSIPTATNVPGAELVLRVHDLAPSAATTVVVNCAGRTRSIIGAQSLINAGIPNKVVALRNGTMGWSLAGLACDSGKNKRAGTPSTNGLAAAKAAAGRVAQRFGIEHIDRATLERWRSEANERTLYLFDVRDPQDYAAGHVAGAISAPGGQLVQATDHYVGTLGARVVLVDDAEVRAVMTASWLKQMGMRDVVVLVERGTETTRPAFALLGALAPAEKQIDCATLATLIERGEATVIDLALSPQYRNGHIPGAWFAIRSRLDQALARISLHGTLVLTSEDGVLGRLAVADAAALTTHDVRYLAGGTVAWQSAGQPLSQELRMADDAIDVWLKPYERGGDTRGAMSEYLSWEVDLIERIVRDGTCCFMTAPQYSPA
jgi:rhodanese-related sulfurtransferase